MAKAKTKKEKPKIKAKPKKETSSIQAEKVCPVCGSTSVRENPETGELICMECGSVVEPEE